MTVAVVLLFNPFFNFVSCTRVMGLWQPPSASFSVFQLVFLEIERLAYIFDACFARRACYIQILGFFIRKLNLPLQLGWLVSCFCHRRRLVCFFNQAGFCFKLRNLAIAPFLLLLVYLPPLILIMCGLKLPKFPWILSLCIVGSYWWHLVPSVPMFTVKDPFDKCTKENAWEIRGCRHILYNSIIRNISKVR